MKLTYGLFCIVYLLTGCVNSSNQAIAPSANLANIEKIFVEKYPPDGRGLEQLIAEELISMGYQATSGESQPEDVDAVITYRDKWRWDVTMYMLSISIKLREPETGFPLAEGNSLHTSLTRKSPRELIREVLTNIFSQK